MPISVVTEKDFESAVLKSDLPVLVDYWASWCAPCKMAEPVLEDLSDQYKGKVTVAKINVDENPETAEKYSVMSIPTTILFKNGEEIGRQVGFAGKGPFEELIKRALETSTLKH